MKSEISNLNLSMTLTLPSNSFCTESVTEILFVLARGSIYSSTIILFLTLKSK